MVDTRRWVGGGDQAVGGGGGVAAACGSRALPGLPRAPSLQVFSKSGLRVLLLLLGEALLQLLNLKLCHWHLNLKPAGPRLHCRVHCHTVAVPRCGVGII